MFTSTEFDGIVALELGAGTGISAISTTLIFMVLPLNNVNFKPTNKIEYAQYDMNLLNLVKNCNS